MIELTIHILNYRTPDLTLACLRTLAAERRNYPHFDVILIDNASGDDSLAVLGSALDREGWRDWIRFLPLERNLGFAGGNNHAMRLALEREDGPPFQLLLNSDTLVHADCLRTSIEWMKDHPRTGAFSCMLRNADGSVQNVCRHFPRPDRETLRALGLPYLLPRLFAWADPDDPGWDRETARGRAVDWIGGAFMLVRSDAIRQAGLMDERFFFYGEDCEWCHRLWRHGWEVRFDAVPSITHLGGASSDASRLLDQRRQRLIWRARFQVQRACYGRWAEYWVRFVYVLAFATRLAWLRLSGQQRTPKYQGVRSNLQVLTHSLAAEPS